MSRHSWIVLGLVCATLALSAIAVWVLSGKELPIPSGWQRPGRLGWQITSRPSDAQVLIDGEARGTTPCTSTVLTGTHQITLQKEHYATWSQEILVQEGQPGQLEAALRFIPYVVAVSQELAFDLVWARDMALCYLTYSEREPRPRVLRPDAEKPAAAFELPPGRAFSYAWDPQAASVLVRFDDDRDLPVRQCQTYSIGSRRWTDLTAANAALLGATAVAWSADGRQLAYLLPTVIPGLEAEGGHADGPQTADLWTCRASGSDAIKIAALPNANRVVWSPDGENLVVESWSLGYGEGRLRLVRLSDHTALELPVLDPCTSAWSDDGEWLAMRGLGPPDAVAEGLWVVDKNGALLQRVGPDVSQEYHWMPGTHQLMYFASTRNQGGSSCWVVDVDSGSRELLADALQLGGIHASTLIQCGVFLPILGSE
ncbi:MAG TPA: PEGA domain-containing protein, partial [Anaerolineae bacterium]|nr:PEGA domain-containing protein [Anaerolineae bacterium]